MKWIVEVSRGLLFNTACFIHCEKMGIIKSFEGNEKHVYGNGTDILLLP